MAFPARLTITAAAFFAALAQVVVAPASCCPLRSALHGDGACCKPRVEAASRSCCDRDGRSASARHGHVAPPSGECLWCVAGPEVAPQERATPPAPALLSLPAAPVDPSGAAPASSRLALDEPFHRTALATCAWLCVWRK